MVAAPTAPFPSFLRIVEKLWEDGDMRLARCASGGHRPLVLVAESVRDPPPAVIARRLEQEYALRAELDADWALLPLALSHEAGQVRLVFEDFDGRVLDRMTDRDWAVFAHCGPACGRAGQGASAGADP
jgi:hypothetical protein